MRPPGSNLWSFQRYSDNKQGLVDLEKRLDSLETMKFPETVDPKAVGRDQLLRYAALCSRWTSNLTSLHRKLGTIWADLDLISPQNMAERMENIAQDEKKIAGCIGDLSDLLTEYQVRQLQIFHRKYSSP
jgi:hypothetical protein